MPTLRLPVPLTDPDRLVVSGDMSAAYSRYEEVEAEKKSITSSYTKQLKELRTRIHVLNGSLIAGTTEKEIEVEDVEDLFAGKVRTIRKDTGDVVKERALDPEERQLKLGGTVMAGGGVSAIDLDSERKKRSGSEPTEEQRADSPEEAEELRAARLAQEEADRQAELDRLEAEQANDTPTLLKVPGRNGKKTPAPPPPEDDDIPAPVPPPDDDDDDVRF